VEEVAHRVDEDATRALPVQRHVESLGSKLQVEATLVVVAREAAPALGEALRVAVSAALGDVRAPGDGIPRRLGPF
jgi:hypothetical protein